MTTGIDTGPSRRCLFGTALLLIVASAALAGGCGGSDGEASAFTPTAGTESAYCDTYRKWQV